jgi:hypothetical protein
MLILRNLVLLAYVTFRAIVEPLLSSAPVPVGVAEIRVAVFAGRSDEEFVAALEDENDGYAHGDV